MSDTDHIDEDEVLRRMLATPPIKNQELTARSTEAARKRGDRRAARSSTATSG